MHERLCRDKNCRISRMVRGTSTVIVVPSQIPQFQRRLCVGFKRHARAFMAVQHSTYKCINNCLILPLNSPCGCPDFMRKTCQPYCRWILGAFGMLEQSWGSSAWQTIWIWYVFQESASVILAELPGSAAASNTEEIEICGKLASFVCISWSNRI